MKGIIAYLGPEGTYCQQAALLHFKSLPPHSVSLRPYSTICQLLYAVDKNEAEWGVVPAENSIEGSVNITLDMLAHELNLYIQKEIVVNIEHQLLSHMKSLSDIHTVMSHPHALAQCRLFIQKELPQAKLVATSSTAEAVRYLFDHHKGLAAIASPESHIIYQVPVIADNIGDFTQNQTRFLMVGKHPCLQEDTKKTSLVLSLKKDRAGGLYEILGEFAKHSINLTRIESRPARKELGKYIFFIDCETGYDHPALKQVLKKLRSTTAMLKVLGSYPSVHS